MVVFYRGLTDSERASHLLQTLRQRFPVGAGSWLCKRYWAFCGPRSATRAFQFPPFQWRWPVGPSFDDLYFIIRQAPCGCPPQGQDVTIDFSEVTTPEDRLP